MSGVIILMFFISAAAAWVDRASPRSALRDYRARSRATLFRMLNHEEAVIAGSLSVFRDFFDRIYGSRTWSRRRILASLLSTTISFFAVIIALGPQRTWVGDLWTHIMGGPGIDQLMEAPVHNLLNVSLIVAVLVFAMNAIPDFFSLAETRLMLRLARGRGPVGVILLTAADLVLTTAIFAPGAGLSLLVIVDGDLRQLAGLLGADLRLYISPSLLLPFLLTTYVTSAMWFLFLATFSLILLIARLRPSFLHVIELYANSPQPTLAFSGLANLVLLAVLPAIIGIAGLFSIEPIPITGTSRESAVSVDVGRVYEGDFRDVHEYWVKFEAQGNVAYTVDSTAYGIATDTLIMIDDSGSIIVQDGWGLGKGLRLRRRKAQCTLEFLITMRLRHRHRILR